MSRTREFWDRFSAHFQGASSLRTARACLIGLHALKMWDWFRKIDFTSPMPIVNVDYIQFYGRALRAHEFLSRSGRFWGYDPTDMAGYVSGPFLEVGVHFLSLVAHVLSPIVPIGVTMLFLEVAGLSLAPFLVVAAVRNMGGTRAQAWSAFGAVVLIVGFLDPFSEPLHRVGLWGFMVSGFVAVLQVSLVWRFLASGKARVGLSLCAVTAVLFQIHPASLVVVLVPNVILFFSYAPRLGWRRLLALAAFVGVALAANYYWIHPFVAFSEWKTDAPYFVTSGFRDVWRMFNPWKSSLFLVVRITMLVYVLGLAIAAVASLWRRNRPLGAAAAFWLVSLFAVGYFGSHLSVLKSMQPGRNSFAFWLVAGVAAGMALPSVALAHRRRRYFAVALYLMCATLMFTPIRRPGSKFPRLTNELPKDQLEFVDALRARRVDARILIESVDLLTPHIADYLPFLIPGQMFLGGQHPGNFTMGRFSLFSGAYVTPTGWVTTEPIAFNRPLSTMGPQTFEEYLDLYNVALVAARTPAMRQALDGYASVFGSTEAAGAYTFYPVTKKFTWFVEGSGRVSFEGEKIVIDGASEGKLVLKAHWIKTLRVEPEAPIGPLYIADDPAPFIEIDNAAGHRRLVVYNAGL